jgi:hypothetical protein
VLKEQLGLKVEQGLEDLKVQREHKVLKELPVHKVR